MGLIFRSLKGLGRGTFLSQSGAGASLSQRLGRVTLSSRGRGSIRPARRLAWATATLLIHAERNGQCCYCSERGSMDPWPCLMARLALHAQSEIGPPTG